MKKTPLHQAHIDRGAKMGEFAGYDMPLFYPAGVMAEHEWVRSRAGLFDVSHMGQVIVEGAGQDKFWSHVTPSSFAALKDGSAKYTVLTNEQGGIQDDLIVTRLAEDKFYAVINAGRKDSDLAWLRSHLPDHLTLTHHEDRALLALQGPRAEAVMAAVFGCDLSDLGFMKVQDCTLDGADCLVSRVGYTGEDGFEISIPQDRATALWEALCGHDDVRPAGLAVRDMLRLEMGFPLYGHDIDERTSPVQAGLRWVIGKDNQNFIGAPVIRSQLETGPARKRIGVKLTGKGIAREGAELRNAQDEPIGALTSGGFSPSLQQAIGMGYVAADYAAPETEIFVNVRGRNIPAVVAKLPFIPARTKSAQKKAA